MTNGPIDDEALHISLESPRDDFQKLIRKYVEVDEYLADDVVQDNYSKIAALARETVWKLLFAEPPPTAEKELEIGNFLRDIKSMACFHSPCDYNDWVVILRDELLKRNMLEFWRSQMVARELGVCWARDSDFYDDLEDPEPKAFYAYAGCEAVFSKAYEPTPIIIEDEPQSPSASSNDTTINLTPLKISIDIPEQNYLAKMREQLDKDGDDEEALKEIFRETQSVIFELLFQEDTLSSSNFEKAADLLKAYKRDACFYAPYMYNDWIYTLRNELFRRKYMEFWKTAVVEAQCGLCWYKDSDYFDDDTDTRPLEFYNYVEK